MNLLYDFLGRIFHNKPPSHHNTPQSRRLHLESLESREMLSISPLEFDAIRVAYPDLNLSANMTDYNVIEITASELSAASLQAAINEAAQTTEDDLIVVRIPPFYFQPL